MAHDSKNWSAQVAEGLKDRFAIERVLGRGGMAVVWLARDRKLKRPVAIKVLDPSVSARIGAERFVREVRITAPLQHPHIVPLLDSGTVGDIVYSVMPFVEGESLRDRLEHESPLPVDQALLFAREIAEALDYAHQRGVVHRDVKPENILISAGAAMIADFGIARAANLPGDASLTSVGMPVGTPAYMSPEQAAGKEGVDGRSDVYSLGCTLFEMLTGRVPFVGTAEEVIRQQREQAPPSPADLRPELAPHVVELVQRALAKRPEDRFPSAGEFALALRGTLGEPSRTPTPPDPRTPVPTRVPTPPLVRRPGPLPRQASGWLMAGSLLVAAIAAAIVIMGVRRPGAADAKGGIAPADSVPTAERDSAPRKAAASAESEMPLPLRDTTAAVSRAPGSNAKGLARYDLTTPTTSARLPPELREASGAETLPDGRIVVHGDELAVLYVVDPATGRSEPFLEAQGRYRAGDYEDVARVDQRLFLVASDGTLLEWNLQRPREAPRAYDSDLGSRCDVESLAYVPPRSALLVLCKHHGLKAARRGVLGFWWPLDQGRYDYQQPFRIDSAGLGAKRFSASGATWDPATKHLLVLAGPDHRLAEVDLDGRVIGSYELDPARHPQAEGITIMQDGRLVIADEGRAAGARIATYAPKPQ